MKKRLLICLISIMSISGCALEDAVDRGLDCPPRLFAYDIDPLGNPIAEPYLCMIDEIRDNSVSNCVPCDFAMHKITDDNYVYLAKNNNGDYIYSNKDYTENNDDRMYLSQNTRHYVINNYSDYKKYASTNEKVSLYAITGLCTRSDLDKYDNCQLKCSNGEECTDNECKSIIERVGQCSKFKDYNKFYENNFCPAEYPICYFGNYDDTGNNYYCSADVECTSETAHVDCKRKIPHWEFGECKNNICVVESCEDGFQPAKDGKSCVSDCKVGQHYDNKAQKCVEDEVDNCGATGKKCSEIISNWVDGVCDNGICKVEECRDGYQPTLDNLACASVKNCQSGEHQTADGSCEMDTVNHCGSIGNDCANLPGWVSGKCVNAKCVAEECDQANGYDLNKGVCSSACIGTQVNCGGKCRDPLTDTEYCGAKGTISTCEDEGKRCSDGQVCSFGECINNNCPETDPNNPDLCVIEGKNTCINLNSDDPNQCGACNYKCSDHALQNATSEACDKGKCVYVCSAGYVNVNQKNTADTIKCIDPKTDNIYCGAKNADDLGTICTNGKVCVEGKCVQNSCSGDTPNLCVVNGANTCKNINTYDKEHCGACNYKCSEHAIQNATSDTCSNGNCQYTCSTGYVNVGSGITSQTIICIDPKTNSTYCGAVGNAKGAASSSQRGTSCTGGKVCVDGSCVQNSCSGTTPNLCVVNGANTCKNISSNDIAHCGACNYKCSEHAIQNAYSSTCSAGNCQYTCSTGYVNVGSGITSQTITCIDPKTNSSYCGATGNAIGAASSTQKGTSCTGGKVCVGGSCVQNSCSGSETLCVVNGANTCKNISSSDANHCGACNYRCSEHAIQNATANKCSDGSCLYTCSTGYVNVGSGITSQTITCIDPKTNNSYCGATGNASGAAGSSQKGTSCTGGRVCVDGSCVQNSCTDNKTLCSTSSGNTCININGTDASNCGACNYKCSAHAIQNATSSTCSGGNCQYTCSTGYVNVGSGITAQTITCIDPKTNSSYCGATGSANGAASAAQKGTACTGGKVCVGGSCVQNSCSGSTPNLCVVNGTNTCKNISSSDADHCGACNYKCSAHAIQNATSSTCSDGNCQYTCSTGYVNVGTGITAQTITCIDPRTNSSYCGATGNATGAASYAQKGTTCTSGKVCVDGTCVQNSCSGTTPNLCVVNGANTCKNISSSDANHCGACNYKCSDHAIQNATSSTCSGGNCQYTCSSGYVNVGNGITAQTITCIDPRTNSSYCGATGNATGAANSAQKGSTCTSGKVCVNGSCVQNSCSDGKTLCSTSSGNTCLNINGTDMNNCGACGFNCSTYAPQNTTVKSCSSGVCQYQCSNGYVNVGNGITAQTITCIDPRTNSSYCGATGNATGAATSAQKGTTCQSGTVCINGACQKSCESGTYSCPGIPGCLTEFALNSAYHMNTMCSCLSGYSNDNGNWEDGCESYD